MADETDNLTHRILRRMEQKIDVSRAEIHEVKSEIRSIHLRIQAVDVNLSGLRGTLAEHSERLDRIERRLDLVNADT